MYYADDDVGGRTWRTQRMGVESCDDCVFGTECVEVNCMPQVCQSIAQKGQTLDEITLLDLTIRKLLFHMNV